MFQEQTEHDSGTELKEATGRVESGNFNDDEAQENKMRVVVESKEAANTTSLR